ncbi:hypothetical protein V6N13_033802 [Hibiscus sabdariffa]
MDARDTTHERPTPEEPESLDDIEADNYARRNRKKTSTVWQELTVVKLADGTKKVQCNHFTNIISGSEYPTSNLLLPELWSIKELLMQKSSTILDPRNKMKLIDFSFRVMYFEDEAPKQICMVRDSLYELYKEYVDEYAAANVNTTMENDVQESGVINTCTTSRIGKGKVLTHQYLYH